MMNQNWTETMLEEFGSPLFLVFEETLVEQYRRLKKVLSDNYAPSDIAYSFKTNYLPKICKTLKIQGALAAVVSGFEYQLAKKLGYAGRAIVFNGPHKTDKELETALREECVINVENREELARIYRVAKKNGKRSGIGIRLNTGLLSLGLQVWTRFGFNIESGEAEEVCGYIKKDLRDFLTIRGFHMHIGSGVHHLFPYKVAAEKFVPFVLKIKKMLGIYPEYLDMGGGFVDTDYKLRDRDIGLVPPVEKFIQSITGTIKAKLEGNPKLIIEPGRFLVAKGMTLVTKVVSVKPRADNVQQIVVDASISLLPEARLIAYDVYAFGANKKAIKTVIYGTSCRANDDLYFGELPPLRAGDILLFQGCGAYSLSPSAQFSYPRPAVLWVDTKGNTVIARRRETGEDLVRLDLLE